MNKGGIYIVQSTGVSGSTPQKIKVLEVTEKTYYIHNLDSGSKYRKLKVEFDRDYKIIEEIIPINFKNVVSSYTGGTGKDSFLGIYADQYQAGLWSPRRNYNELSQDLEKLNKELDQLHTNKDKE